MDGRLAMSLRIKVAAQSHYFRLVRVSFEWSSVAQKTICVNRPSLYWAGWLASSIYSKLQLHHGLATVASPSYEVVCDVN